MWNDQAFKHNEHPTPDEIRTPTIYIFGSLASREPMIVTGATKSRWRAVGESSMAIYTKSLHLYDVSKSLMMSRVGICAIGA